MTTATLTALPPQPVRPAEYDALVLHANLANAANRAAIRSYTHGKVSWELVKATQAEALSRYTLINEWWGTAAGVAYRELVDAYETARVIRRTERATLAQASVNRRAVTAVRSAACPVCSATHPGEC